MPFSNSVRAGVFTLAAIAGISGSASAQNAILESNNMLGISFVNTRFGYAETGNGILGLDGQTLDTEKDWVPGMRISASMMRNLVVDKLYVSGTFTWNSGNTKYTGSYLGGTFGSLITQNGAEVRDFDFRIGKGFQLNPAFMVTPFVGFGTHQWERKVNAGETYKHDYIGVGAMLQYAASSQLVLSADALIGGTKSSHIDVAYIDPLFIGFSGGLGNSTLYKLGLGADYAFTRELHLNAGLEFTSFKYGMSDLYLVGGGLCCVGEPVSTTNNLSARVGISYAFGAK